MVEGGVTLVKYMLFIANFILWVSINILLRQFLSIKLIKFKF